MEVVLPVPGEHNVYNAMTAIAAACLNGIVLSDTRQGILKTKAGFGRMERFRIRDREACIVLVKNPVGLERALDFLANATDAGSVLMLLNDGIADGTDVSWIWDVDFESKKFPRQSFVSGTRCYDMALRLQYAGVPKERITASYGFTQLFEKALAGCEPGECLYVLPNYTSLLELRSYLSKEYHLKEIWK
jgi:UDP-N-acetylmuramyl tripeptide synthase